PFFYKDAAHPSTNHELTFFVQPSLTEKTVVEWTGWAVPPERPAQNWADASVLDQINVVAQVPAFSPVPVNPGDPQLSVFPMQNMAVDWASHPSTVISYGNVPVGRGGGISISKSAFAASTGLTKVGIAGLAGSIASGRGAMEAGLTLVGRHGLNLSQMQTTKSTQPAVSAAKIVPLAFKQTV